MSDPSEQLRVYRAWVEQDHQPVDPASLRVAATNQDEVSHLVDATFPPIELDRADGRRHRLAVAAAVIVVVVVAAAILVSRTGELTTGPAGSTQLPATTQLAPHPTQLPPVDADPMVSCKPERDEWFRRSALDGPKGAENDPDPAAKALKKSIEVQALANRVAGGPLVAGLPADNYRRLAVADDRVLFGAGDLVGELPMLSFVDVRKVGDEWQVQGSGGGSCRALYVKPPDGATPVSWTVDQQNLPGADATKLHLTIQGSFGPCGPQPLTLDDVIGPDVIETDASITIRVASRQSSGVPDQHCGPPPIGESSPPLRLEIPLVKALGNRTVLNGDVYPAAPLELASRAPTGSIPPVPRIEVPGGTVEARVEVQVNNGHPCDPTQPETCGIRLHAAHVTATAASGSVEGDTNAVGMIVVVVPDGTTDIAARADGLWCARTVVTRPPSGTSVACTRLDAPHATVRGRALRPLAGTPVLISFHQAGRPYPVVQQITAADGTYEVVLEPGEWIAEAIGTTSTSNCPGQLPNTLTVVDGGEQQLDITCNT